MNNTSIILLVGLFILIIVGVLWLLLRKLTKENKITKLSESEIEWQEIKCPKCQHAMECGYSMAGRGVIWREKHAKRPGLFATIFSALDNTMSISAPPALNLSWHCQHCKLIMLDHSKMVKVKKHKE